MIKTIKSTAIAAGLMLSALVGFTAPATAATLTDTSATLTTADANFSWTVDFICSSALPCNGGDPVDTLTASAVFTLTSVSNGAWAFNLVLTNTSASAVEGFLTALGFNTDPNATMTNFVDSDADGIQFVGGSGAIPGYNTELCVWEGPVCQGGGPDHSLTSGKSDTMSFVLNTAVDAASLMFSNFAVKVQGAGPEGGSYEFGGRIPAPVPLPAAGGLLLAGLGGLALLKRKCRQI
jgi:hypothetical protein